MGRYNLPRQYIKGLSIFSTASLLGYYFWWTGDRMGSLFEGGISSLGVSVLVTLPLLAIFVTTIFLRIGRGACMRWLADEHPYFGTFVLAGGLAAIQGCALTTLGTFSDGGFAKFVSAIAATPSELVSFAGSILLTTFLVGVFHWWIWGLYIIVIAFLGLWLDEAMRRRDYFHDSPKQGYTARANVDAESFGAEGAQ